MRPTYVAAESFGKLRKILKFDEKPNGDVIVVLTDGIQDGIPPNNKLIIHDRYSIHSSANSETHTTVKLTREYLNGEKQTYVALTNCVKTNSGFSPVFATRFTDLRDSVHDFTKSQESSIELTIDEFDPSNRTLYLSLLIGNVETPFPPIEGVRVSQRVFSKVRVVLLYVYNNFSATPFGWQVVRITVKPKDENDSEAIQLLNGESVDWNVDFFQKMYRLLFRNQIETLLPLIPEEDEETIRHNLLSVLNKIPKD